MVKTIAVIGAGGQMGTWMSNFFEKNGFEVTGFDPENPGAVRFRWLTQGNTVLENWQVSHFRLLGNDAFLPYGSSVLESARRIWRQLILIEDAMLVYRVIRSPERRVFYIDVGNVPPETMQADFDGRVDILPVSDPNIFSMAQRLSLAQTQLQLATSNPQIVNRMVNRF